MRTLRTLLLGLLSSAVGPIYLGVMAYAARQAPWPRSFAIAAATVLGCLALAAFAAALVRGLFRSRGWAESTMQVPPPVARQLRHALTTLVVAAVALLIPEMLLSDGLIAPGGRPISAPATCQFLVLSFELIAWAVVFRLLDRRAALVQWMISHEDRLVRLNRHRRVATVAILAAIGAVIVLDVRGYSFTARRLAVGAGETLVLVAFCWGLYCLILKAIDRHAWRWIRTAQPHMKGVGYPASEATDASGQPVDMAARLRRLAAYLVPLVGVVLGAWIWNVDLALFKFLGRIELWQVDATTSPRTWATVGDVTEAAVIVLLTVAALRHMSTLFTIAIFPRMPDDPGMRFAVLTLCRYAVLGIGLLTGLASVHLGPDKIGMVLAALGVGLGFGLQEIVSNFVCGIILLLERPIRVGDIVTVSEMTGRVDRINIRATTIINGENQSFIVPNRAFITGDLINWTLKDKIIRVTIRLKVAYGTDPDRVSDLLLAVAREDADVLLNPVPASFMEDFGDSSLIFALHVHVPDPSLGSRVRHRLFAQIQKRFKEAAIEIPLPAQQLSVKAMGDPAPSLFEAPRRNRRYDPAQATPPASWLGAIPQETPSPVADCHRGVDE